MRCRQLHNARTLNRCLERTLHALLVQMIATYLAATRIDRQASSRKHILPTPIPGTIWILALKREWQVDIPPALLQFSIMASPDQHQVLLEALDQTARQNGYAILHTFAITNQNFPPRKIDILDPQPHHFH